MKAYNRSGFHYKRSENTSSKVVGMHRKVDTKTLNKLSGFWPTDYKGFWACLGDLPPDMPRRPET